MGTFGGERTSPRANVKRKKGSGHMVDRCDGRFDQGQGSDSFRRVRARRISGSGAYQYHKRKSCLRPKFRHEHIKLVIATILCEMSCRRQAPSYVTQGSKTSVTWRNVMRCPTDSDSGLTIFTENSELDNPWWTVSLGRSRVFSEPSHDLEDHKHLNDLRRCCLSIALLPLNPSRH